MTGKVKRGDRVTVVPAAGRELAVGEIVLMRVPGHVNLHLIKATQRECPRIGNNRGGIDGWVGPHSVYGVAAQVESGR